MPWRLFRDGEFESLNRHLPARETYVARSVLDVSGNTAPWLEVEGRIYTAFPGDQEDHRRLVERSNCEGIIARLGGRDAKTALLRITTHLNDEHNEEVTEVIKDIGRFLMVQRHPELWKLLYLRLCDLHTGQVCDRMTDAFTVSGYQEGDEFRFLFGTHWQGAVESYCDTSEDDAVRAAVDGPPDREEAEVVTGPPLNAITSRPTDEPETEAFPA